MPALTLPLIYAITDRKVSGVNDHAEIARRLFDVGIRLLQVREKEIPDSDLLAAVDRVAAMGREQGARVLINDRADIAHLAGVGVHLGHEDLPAPAARRLLADGSLVGVSTHDPDAAARAFADPACDYVA
ncbi:MAG TPA: thiamine phosphate synthase, partial [Thermoanaerobaculia bacterium]|nr:thiamine phosphate synthase [Thermoanaerobaculia bacterium]